jgi:ketosteroid isomerase-like protein
MQRKACFAIALMPILAACATSRPSSVSQSENTRLAVSAPGPMQFAGSGDPEAQRLIGQMEDDWGRATLRSDSATIGGMIAGEYFSATRDTVENRAETLRDFGTVDPNITGLTNEDSARIVRVYNNDAAVVMAIGRTSSRNNKTGEETRYVARYVETWIRRDGRWQVVAGAYQDLPVPKATLTQQLMRAEQDYREMFDKRDSPVFQRLVADSVTFASGTGPVETKAQLWDDVQASDFRTNVVHVDRAYVSGTGDVGVVNGTIDRTLKDGSTVHLRYANTWVYRGGAWILLARQLVPETTRGPSSH